MKCLPCILTIIALQAGQAAAQDPWTAAPDHYKVELDNADVRIIRVTHAPHSKAAMHQHAPVPRVIVQLTGGEVRVTDSAGKSFIVHSVPGHYLYGPGAKELPHQVENLGDMPVEALRIEFKGSAAGADGFSSGKHLIRAAGIPENGEP